MCCCEILKKKIVVKLRNTALYGGKIAGAGLI